MAIRSLVFALLVVNVFLSVVTADTELFNPKRLRFIDRTNEGSGLNNWLFRGNEPKNSSNMFNYDQLKQVMASAAQTQANATLPTEFYLVDISWENVITEDGDISMEEAFFKSNPSLGQFINWPIVGSVIGPDEYSPAIRNWMLAHTESWWIDDVPTRIDKLYQLLYSAGPNNMPVVIYNHCEAGTDRTGEMSGSYYIRYMNMTFQEALYVDNHVNTRDMYTASRNGMQWYCYYINYYLKFNLDCDV